jgi:predicted nucleic acid-binding protein
VYILDLNVLNIIDGSRRDGNVLNWYRSIDETEIYLCVLTLIEISKNATRLSKRGEREMAAKVEDRLATLKALFAGRILALDVPAAEDWGRMLGEKEKEKGSWDAGIAAIAKQHEFVVATRNVKDYAVRGATVIDPFKKPAAITKPTR